MEDPTTDEPERLAIVARIAADPGGAFEELFGSVAPSVFAWACLHVREPLRRSLDPEDVLQEVSCRAYEGLAQFDPSRGTFREWVFGIARNVLLSAMRRLGARGPSAAALDSARLGALPDPATTLTRRVANEEGLRRFVARLEELDEADRRLLVLRGFEGRSHAEVGTALGLQAKTAAKRWDRLLLRLRSELGAPEIFLSA